MSEGNRSSLRWVSTQNAGRIPFLFVLILGMVCSLSSEIKAGQISSSISRLASNTSVKTAGSSCFRLYRADILQQWEAPIPSILCNKQMNLSNPLYSAIKIGTPEDPGIWVSQTNTNQWYSLDDFWISEEPASKDFSIFLGQDKGFNVFITFRFANSQELIGLISVEKSAMKSTIRNIIYLSTNDLKISKNSFTVLIHFNLLIVAGVLYIWSFFYPLSFFSSVFIPVFYLSLSVYHGTTEMLSNARIFWSFVVCLSAASVLGTANLKFKSNFISLIFLAAMIVFAFYGAGSTCCFLFIGSFILYVVLAISNHPPNPETSLPYTWKSWIRRNASISMMGLGSTIYACTSWDDLPSTLYLRWKYMDYSKHCWTETEIFRSLAIGIIVSIVTGIILTFRLRRRKDIAQDPWERDFLHWLMDPSYSRHGSEDFLHESLPPQEQSILGDLYLPDNAPSNPPDEYEAYQDRTSINRSSLSPGHDPVYMNGKSRPHP